MTPRGSLLLVDDDSNYPFLMRQAFLKEGWEQHLEVAGDGLEAQRRLQDTSLPRPRVVLCDLKLPGLHGFELLDWVREQKGLRQIPMVMHSWVTTPDDLRRAYEAGANAFLQKPMSFENLRRLVKTLGLYWLVYNQTS